MRSFPPVRAGLLVAAVAIAAAAGLADWALFLPDSPFDAWMGTAIASSSATAFVLPPLFR